MVHYNNLTAAEDERLSILTEEIGEVLQIIGKINRHGYNNEYLMSRGLPSNKVELEKELGHLRSAMIRLCDAGDLSKEAIHASADDKTATIMYLHHQDEVTPQVQLF